MVSVISSFPLRRRPRHQEQQQSAVTVVPPSPLPHVAVVAAESLPERHRE
jgi:hypothetical protein